MPHGPDRAKASDMIASHDAAARTFTLEGKHLTSTYPIEDFPKWLRFYQEMKADYPKAKGAYDETVASLEALARALETATP